MSGKKIALITCGVLAGLSVLIVTGIILIGVLAAIIIPTIAKPQDDKIAAKHISQSLLQSFQSAAAIYVAQQRVPPRKFSDFVVLDGPATGQYTLTLQNVRSMIDEPNSRKDLNSTSFDVQFKSGYEATYYLNGTDVTAVYQK